MKDTYLLHLYQLRDACGITAEVKFRGIKFMLKAAFLFRGRLLKDRCRCLNTLCKLTTGHSGQQQHPKAYRASLARCLSEPFGHVGVQDAESEYDSCTRTMPQVIVLTGPTAVGKTKASLALAERVGGEIISADSVQVYKGLDVGSDKVIER